MKNIKEKRKIIFAMIFGYSLGLASQFLDFKEETIGHDKLKHDSALLSLGNIGVAIAIGCFLVLAFREKNLLLKVIYILATIPFVFGISVIENLNKPYLNHIEILSTIILLLLMGYYLMRNRERE